jgi:predicted DNA-binding protein
LSRPYSSGPQKVPLTVSSVKMSNEVWERLGWAAKLTGQTQQDIIAEALKDHFQKLLRHL